MVSKSDIEIVFSNCVKVKNFLIKSNKEILTENFEKVELNLLNSLVSDTLNDIKITAPKYFKELENLHQITEYINK